MKIGKYEVVIMALKTDVGCSKGLVNDTEQFLRNLYLVLLDAVEYEKYSCYNQSAERFEEWLNDVKYCLSELNAKKENEKYVY